MRSISDILARLVPTRIWHVLISLHNMVASFGSNAYRCVRRPTGSHASPGHAQPAIAACDSGADRLQRREHFSLLMGGGVSLSSSRVSGAHDHVARRTRSCYGSA